MRLSSTAMARSAARHPWRTIGLWAAALLAAVAIIVLVLPGTLTSQYTFIGHPGSQVGRDLLAQKMGMPQKANEVVIVRSPSLTATDPAFRAYTLALQRRIAALGPGVVDSVASYARGGDPATMVSKDGRTAIIPLTMAGDLTQAEHNIGKVHAIVHAADGRQGFSTLITGTASINSDFSQTANHDLRQGEGIGVPIALVILLIVFGALVAAMLPIFLALIAITMAVALTALVGQTFSMSVFAVNMISMMGLATGIDYSLFIVSRFREERARGRDKIDAIGIAGGTATRAVVFSGLTVILALCGLLIVPTNIFVSLAAGAILVVSASVVAALTLLPAVLGLLGDRVNSLRVPYLGKRLIAARSSGRPSWIARVAQRAMRRPALTLVIGVAVLLAAAAPALTMKTGVSGVNTFPDSFQSKKAFGILNSQFSVGGVNPAQVVIDSPAGSAVTSGVARLKAELARDPAFGPPQTQASKTGDLTLVSVPVNGDAQGNVAIAKVRELRGTLVPQAFGSLAGSVYVTGATAGNIDYIDIVNSHFAWVVALVLLLSFVLLLVAFRSVVIPAKAIIMNLLSVGAAYGLITLVSLHGVGAGILGFQQVSVIEQWVPLFLFSILFGLSMDYQVFLLSRIKEEWDRTGDNTRAVASGVGSTAGIITGAALIMVAVFAGFASGDLVMFQQMGFGLAVAVLLDATLIRTLLVPAAMKLLGRWNWYLPQWLAWLPHIGIEGSPGSPPAEVLDVPAAPAGAPEERVA